MKDRVSTEMGRGLSGRRASGPCVEATDRRKGAVFVQESRHGGH